MYTEMCKKPILFMLKCVLIPLPLCPYAHLPICPYTTPTFTLFKPPLIEQLDLLCRDNGACLVACNVLGAAGYVFDDFGSEFEVSDATGEESKEVPLLDNALIKPYTASTSASGSEGSVLVQVTAIDEERLGLGIGDEVHTLYMY
jgi:hypothetical protein